MKIRNAVVFVLAVHLVFANLAFADEVAEAETGDYGEEDEGFHTHDGFFLRLGVGFGYAVTSSTYKGMEFKIDGVATFPYIGIGASVTENFQLSFDIFGAGIMEPTFEVEGKSASESTADVYMSGGGLGACYYFMPSNLFLGGAFGFSRMQLEVQGRKFETDTGFQSQVYLGKEWWVSDNWGLGVMGQYIFYMHPEKKVDATWYGHSFGVFFSATYN